MILKMSGRKNISSCFFSFQHASGLLSQGRLQFLFSLFQHIRSILDVIYPPSSGVTKCYLTNYWLPSPSSHLAGRGCVWQCVCDEGRGKRGGHGKKRRLGEWWGREPHRGGKEVVTSVYVSAVFIRWMTYLHLCVIALLWLNPLPPCCAFLRTVTLYSRISRFWCRVLCFHM